MQLNTRFLCQEWHPSPDLINHYDVQAQLPRRSFSAMLVIESGTFNYGAHNLTCVGSRSRPFAMFPCEWTQNLHSTPRQTSLRTHPHPLCYFAPSLMPCGKIVSVDVKLSRVPCARSLMSRIFKSLHSAQLPSVSVSVSSSVPHSSCHPNTHPLCHISLSLEAKPSRLTLLRSPSLISWAQIT